MIRHIALVALPILVVAWTSCSSDSDGERRKKGQTTAGSEDGRRNEGEADAGDEAPNGAVGSLHFRIPELALTASDASFSVVLKSSALAEGEKTFGPYEPGADVTIDDLPVGTYEVWVRQLDANGKALAEGRVTVKVKANEVAKTTVAVAPVAQPIGDLDVPAGDQLASADDAACKAKVDYDPTSIECAIPLSAASIWRRLGFAAMMTDQAAAWLAPLAATDSGSGPACVPPTPTGHLLYVTSFNVPKAGAYQLESLTDVVGVTIGIWPGGDPAKDAVQIAPPATRSTPLTKKTVALGAGRQVIVVANPNDPTASAVALSITDPAGAVAKRTLADGSWCIFRLPPGADVKTFVLEKASCRRCFTGP